MSKEAGTSLVRAALRRLGKVLTPRVGKQGRHFRLPEREPERPSVTRERVADLVRHARLVDEKIGEMLAAMPGRTVDRPAPSSAPKAGDISTRLKDNLARIKETLHQGESDDVKVRRFRLGTEPAREAAIVYIDGMTDTTLLSEAVVEPLMIFSRGRAAATQEDLMSEVEEVLTPHGEVTVVDRFQKVVDGILAGDSALFVDGSSRVLIVDTKGFEQRSIGEPKVDVVVRGSKEAFIENPRVNTSMIRRYLHASNLVIEGFRLGRISRTQANLLYIKDIANPALVEEVRRRVKAIDVDYLVTSGMLEQYIEDNPTGLFPSVLATERPDRVAAYLTEGHVALVVAGSPFAIIAPATAATWFQTSEDYDIRWPYGTLLRWLRFAGALIALFLPAGYVAVANYHQEMIPTALMLSIAAAREAVPFPVIGEVLLMEFSFDLIREAGIRIPTVIGPTIGIVGALILGQAAVQAGIVSPILVIIVALTALGAFTVPDYGLNLSFRALHYVMVFLASILGLFGLGAGFFLFVAVLSASHSFGVPLLSPIAPAKPSSPDVLVRAPLFRMERRPAHIRPEDPDRQAKVQRPWARATGAQRRSKGKRSRT